MAIITPPPQCSAAFCALLASSFFEAQRRQNRHMMINNKYTVPGDSSWQISLPERLFGISHLGLFTFDFFATSMPGQLVFADANHPMVTHGRMAPPTADAAIATLRAKHPQATEFHASVIDGDDMLMHGVCSIAVVETDALFYYRCPNGPGAVWIIVKAAVDATLLPSIPQNLAVLAPPRDDFVSYTAVVDGFERLRPAGQAVRLNDFRINLMSMLSQGFPPGVTTKAMVVAFLQRNAYQMDVRPHASTQEDEEEAEEEQGMEDVVALVNYAPTLTTTFDVQGRLRTVNMQLTSDAYADDGFDL